MPLQDGEYVKLTEDEIQQRFENELLKELDASAQPGDLVTKQLRAEAATLAQNQEQALERVHQAAYLADATDKELDKVVDIIGLSRQEATPATGTVRLSRESPPTADYTIASGKEVQTSGTDPIVFSITQQNSLAYIDGFENGALANWTGDTAAFSVNATNEMTGGYALEVPATSGVQITSDDDSFTPGTTFNLDIKPSTDSVIGFRFGLQDQSNYFEVEVAEKSNDLSFKLIEDDTVSSSSTNSTPIPNDESSHLEVEWGLYDDLTATLYESNARDTVVSEVSLSASAEWESGAVAIAGLDDSATALIDEVATRSVLCNVRAVDTGTETNLGPNTITTISGTIPGVESVTNPVATGDPNEVNTEFSPFVLGEEREEDEELRERAFETTSIGGAATVNAIKTELQRVDGVKALTLNRNRKSTSVDGMPEHSFEAIVYGGSSKDIANAIFDSAAIDSNDVGGINGTEETYTITSDVTNSEEVMHWSRPVSYDLNITLDLIVDDTFVGETEIRSIITNYIGGTDIDGNFVTGLDVGEDVYEAVLNRKVVSPEDTGVWEVDSLTIDKDNDGSDDTTTTASGAEVLAIANNEVAEVNARDGSITVNTITK